MKSSITGMLRITASGNDLYGFINQLRQSSVRCSSQYVKKDVLYADIRRSDLKETESVAAACGITLNYTEYETLSLKVRRYRKRLGLIFGAVLVIIFSLYFSNVIVSIEITGNTTISDEAILAALEELDIKRGTPLKDLDLHYCENELRVMVTGVSWASIRHTGSRVVVDIREIVEKPETELKRMPCNIVSAKDAEICYTSVFDGMLMHKVGDYVPAGTLLVTGVISDDTGHCTLHHAMGEIRGIYEENVVFSGDYTTEELTPTGKSKTKRSLHLFSLDIPLYIGKKDYDYFESEQTESYLNIFGRQLPLGIHREKLTETKSDRHTLTKEQLSERLMEKIYLYEKNFLRDKKILNRTITEENTEDSLTYNVTYQLEGDIGVQREIFVK